MKTPKEIYLLQKGSRLLGTWSGTPQIEISGGWYSAEYKYIRADLVEQKPALDDYLKATPAERRKMSMTEILDKEHKPAEWSEEDEKFFETALWHISYSISNRKSTDVHCDTTYWLKSIKERLKSIRPQSHWKPSKEQPEVDLEKEVSNYLKMHHLHIKDGGRVVFLDNNDSPNFICDIRDIARHFAKWGAIHLNARKEE